MIALEFYNLTKNRLEKLAKDNNVKNLSRYYSLTDFAEGSLLNNYKGMAQIFAQMAFHAQNATMISSIVKFNKNIDLLNEVTFNFDPVKFNSVYNTGNREEDIDKLVEKFRYDEVKNPNGLKWNSSKSKNRKDGIIRRYSNTLLDRAEFLNKYKNRKQLLDDLKKHYIDKNGNRDCKKLITYFNGGNDVKNGFSIALTCDFLKEFDVLFNDLPKPDIHIKDTLCALYGFDDGYYNSAKKEYECISTMQSIVKYINSEMKSKNKITVYQLDRMIWLVCTGNFFLDNAVDSKTSYISSISDLREQFKKN